MPEIISRADAERAGLKRYFTGEACKNGHVAERAVSIGQCVGCRQRYYLLNKDSVVAKVKERYSANPSAVILRVAKWKNENRDRVQLSSKKCYHRDIALGKVKIRDKDKHRKQSRESHLRKNYGMTVDQWHILFASQDNCCAICREPNPKGGRWDTDHCHDTGAVRGILCHLCNMGLGAARDSIPILKSMIAYLERHEQGSCAADPPASGFQDPSKGRAHPVGGPFVCLAIQ